MSYNYLCASMIMVLFMMSLPGNPVQDKDDILDLLQYLPGTEYESVYVNRRDVIKKYMESNSKISNRIGSEEIFSDAIREMVVIMAEAQPAQYEVVSKREYEDATKRTGMPVEYTGIGAGESGIINEAGRIQIVLCDNYDGKLQYKLEREKYVQISRKSMGTKMYRYDDGKKVKYVMNDDNMILIAEDEDILANMMRAKKNTITNFLDSDVYKIMSENIEEDMATMRVIDYRWRLMKLSREITKTGDVKRAQDAELEAGNRLCYLETVMYTSGSSLVKKQYRVYNDNDGAIKMYNQTKNYLNRLGPGEKRSNTSIVNNVVVTTTEIDIGARDAAIQEEMRRRELKKRKQ